MGKSALECYALAVCFVGVLYFFFALFRAIYGIVQMTYPEVALSAYEYNRHLSNDAFWETKEGKGETKKVRPPEDELTRQREESYVNALKGEKHEAMQGILQSIIGLSINIAICSIHWHIAASARLH